MRTDERHLVPHVADQRTALYAGLSSLEKLSELLPRLGHGCHEPYGPPTTIGRSVLMSLRLPINTSSSEFAQRYALYIIWTSIWAIVVSSVVCSCIYCTLVYSPAE